MSKNIMIKLNNEKGSASVIVVIFMLVLVILALTALMTAVANENLTEKTNTLLNDYNILDQLAKQALVEIETSSIDDFITRIDNNKSYIEYVVSDEKIPDKWIEVSLIVKDDTLIIDKWILKQGNFEINEQIEYFDGKFED